MGIANFNNGVHIANPLGPSFGSATGNVVLGNLIGTDATGTLPLANHGDGVRLDSGVSGNVIGGTAVGARNVISGNTLSGVTVADAGTTGNMVEGNYVGT